MFNSYNDAQLMNESFVFYTSTNTFKNPAFARDVWLPEDLPPINQPSLGYHPLGHATTSIATNFERNHTLQQQGDREARLPSSCLLGRSYTREKLIDFCDSFAFSLQGKVFIMETNFKRRLRGLKKFLNKRLMPWVAPCYHYAARKRSQESRDQNMDVDGGRSSTSDGRGGCHLGNLARRENLQQQQRRQYLSRDSDEFAELMTTRGALGLQQERILTRLERIKRDSQKLFIMQRANHSMRPNNEPAVYYADRGADCQMARGDLRELETPIRIPLWLKSSSQVASKSSGDGKTENDDDLLASNEIASKPSRTSVRARARTTVSRWASISSGGKQMTRAATYALSAQPKKTCIVCYERAPNIETLPCKHADICSDCFIEIIYMAVKNSQYPLRCVLCRQKVERIRCSRRLMLSVIKKN